MQPEYQEHSLEELNNGCVEALWSFNPLKLAYHKVLPDGRIDFLVRFKFRGKTSISDVRPIIAGPAQRFVTVPADRGSGFFGMRFRPGWGGVCLGINAVEIRDTALVGNDAIGILGSMVTPLLRSSTVDQLKVRLIELIQTFVGRMPQNPQHIRVLTAIKLLDRSDGTKCIASLANDVGASVRTLHRDFSAAVGLSAKSFASILRFQRTIRLLHMRPSISLTELASAGGYSDQAHMTREFRELGGFTPGLRPNVTIINGHQLNSNSVNCN